MPIKIHEMVIRVNLKDKIGDQTKAQREVVNTSEEYNSNYKGINKIREKKNER